VETNILKGMYLLREGEKHQGSPRVQLLGSGTILREVIAAANLLEGDFGVSADIWSVTSFNELRREALAVERWNMLHPQDEPRLAHLQSCLKSHDGPVIAATDYVKLYSDQIFHFLPGRHVTALGTDGFGRSDTREQLRRFFEVDRYHVVVAAMKALSDINAVPRSKVSEAICKYGIDTEKPHPPTV
jgi:pyruvate dehydrogenase E1 component